MTTCHLIIITITTTTTIINTDEDKLREKQTMEEKAKQKISTVAHRNIKFSLNVLLKNEKG